MVFLNKNDLSFNIPFSWCQCFNALGICCIKICEQAVTVVSIGVFLIFFHAFSYSGVYFQGIWLIFLCYSHINKRGRKSSLPLISKKPLLFLFLKLNAPLLRETTQQSTTKRTSICCLRIETSNQINNLDIQIKNSFKLLVRFFYLGEYHKRSQSTI